MKAHYPWLSAALLALTCTPFTVSAACAGKGANLQSFAGKYLADHNLLAAPAVAARLQRLPEKERLHLQRNLDVSGPILLDGCHLVITGNAQHMGTEQDAMLDVDLASGDVTAAIHDGGRIDIWFLAEPPAGAPRWETLPMAMREWAVKADMGFPSQPPRSLAQPRSVHFHVPPASTSNAVADAGAPPVKIDIGKDAIKPTPAQTAAIRRATENDPKDPLHPDQPLYSVALADLNDDMAPCGSSGCSGVIVMATPTGYASKPIRLPNFGGEIDILPTKHQGMHDLRFNGDSPVWQWNGKQYGIDKADLPGSNAPPWQTRQAAGHPLMAVATPIDSTIKDLLVFCEQGHPLLAMVTKMPLPAGPVTLTFAFRGWTVSVPMQRNRQTKMLWTADLSRSELPQWLAHRGTTATTSKLAGLATESFLRINGQMQGEISLEGSTQATQATLGACYRY